MTKYEPEERKRFGGFIAPQYRFPDPLKNKFICSITLNKQIKKFNKEIKDNLKVLMEKIPFSEITFENINEYYGLVDEIRKKLERIDQGVIRVNKFSLLQNSKDKKLNSGENTKLMAKDGAYYIEQYAQSWANDIQDSVAVFLNHLDRGIAKEIDYYKDKLEEEKREEKREKEHQEYLELCNTRSKNPEFKIPEYLRDIDASEEKNEN